MSGKKIYDPLFEIRQSQLLTPFGIGSIIELKNQSLMVGDSNYWDIDESNIVHDVRLQKVMKSTGFVEPPQAKGKFIAMKRFPRWYFSPASRELKTFADWESKISSGFIDKFYKRPFHPRRPKEELIPVRILCICKNGHTQDFPWLEWAHRGKIDQSKIHNHSLKLISPNHSGYMGEMSIKCEKCNVSQNLSKIFSNKTFSEKIKNYEIECNGEHLWKKSPQKTKCDATLVTILRNASNFYFPNISTSVNIPFDEDDKMLKIMSSNEFENLKNNFDGEDEDSKTIVNISLRRIAKETGLRQEEVEELVESNLLLNNKKDDFDIMEYRHDEFEVLMGRRKFNNKSGKLAIQIIPQQDLKEKNIHFFDNVTLVHQLEVLNVLKSYSRLNVVESQAMNEKLLANEDVTEAEEVSLKRDDNTYVGMRSSGEGIFISFDKEKLKTWYEKYKNCDEFSIINGKRTKFLDRQKFISPKYYLIHTFSHLLINQLSEICGYSAASLKERLYYSKEKEKEMYGVLIYISSSDIDGTLGGLVRQGVTEKLNDIISDLIRNSEWCSYDPVCIETTGQGNESLNGAACHGCSLISETSCENMNSFLDRRTIMNESTDGLIGFFKQDSEINQIIES